MWSNEVGAIEGAPVEAREPFEFAAASYLFRIQREEATNLLELQRGIESCTDASIFYYLAERLASVDIRDYVSLAELRCDLLRIISEYCQESPREVAQVGFEAFHYGRQCLLCRDESIPQRLARRQL